MARNSYPGSNHGPAHGPNHGSHSGQSGTQSSSHQSAHGSIKTLACGRTKPAPVAPPSPKQFDVWRNQLKDYLVSRNLKFTEQRWKIAELILSTGGHLDAQALVDQVKKRHSGIGAATVYRSIKVLCDAAILKESLIDGKGRIFYELFDKHHHDHIICLDCGEIFEFFDHKIESQQSAVLQKMQFEEVGHRHIVYAHCNYENQNTK